MFRYLLGFFMEFKNLLSFVSFLLSVFWSFLFFLGLLFCINNVNFEYRLWLVLFVCLFLYLRVGLKVLFKYILILFEFFIGFKFLCRRIGSFSWFCDIVINFFYFLVFFLFGLMKYFLKGGLIFFSCKIMRICWFVG